MSKNWVGSRKKTVLGRGLGSLLSPQDFGLEETRSQTSKTLDVDFQEEPTNKKIKEDRVLQIGIEKLIRQKGQPRKEFNKDSLEQLSLSIKEQGILQPIVVRPQGDFFEIIAGERRWRAAGLAGLKTVPVLLKDIEDERKIFELAVIENIQREDLNPLEEAQAYESLMNFYSLNHQEVAKKVGKKRSTITNSLRLLSLVPELKKAVSQGVLPIGQAKLLLGIENHELQLKLGREVIKKSLTVKQCQRLINKYQNTTYPQEKGRLRDSYLQVEKRLSEELQKILKTQVKVQYSKQQSQVNLFFYSDEMLNQFVEKVRNLWKN